MASRDEFEQANQRAKDLKARIPRAVSAHYDRKTPDRDSSQLQPDRELFAGDVEGL